MAYPNNGILDCSKKHTLIVRFSHVMPRVFYAQYKSGNLDKLLKPYVDKYLNCFHRQGYEEAQDLPYEYDLNQKCLTVKFLNKAACALGWAEAVGLDRIPF